MGTGLVMLSLYHLVGKELLLRGMVPEEWPAWIPDMSKSTRNQVIDDSKCVSFLRVNRGLPCLFDIDTILNVVYSL